MPLRLHVLLAAALLSAAPAAFADTFTYTYTSDPFTSFSNLSDSEVFTTETTSPPASPWYRPSTTSPAT